MLDDVLNNLELNIVRGAEVRDSTIHEEELLRRLTFMDEKIHVTPIIKNQVRSVILNITLRLYQGIKDAVPVLRDTINLPGKHSRRFIMRYERNSVVLGR